MTLRKRTIALATVLTAIVLGTAALLRADELRKEITAADLPVGSNPEALAVEHFPDRLHALVWRNWGLVAPERLAEVVQATPEQIREIAASMGLPVAGARLTAPVSSLYITIIRRNWHLLPYEQLLTLIEMTPEQLAFSLREDDFLFHKLGNLKPLCEPLRYTEPGPEAKKRAAEIRALVEKHFGAEWARPGEPLLGFIERLSTPPPETSTARKDETERPTGPRYLYSYYATYGDPLLGEGPDPYPDGLLARLAAEGVNGVWIHTVLRQLAPGGPDFPEFGERHEERLEALRQLVARAKRHGLDIYLYMNEPRTMPLAFFESRPEMLGVRMGDFGTLCTSDPRVRAWLAGALEHVFREVPGLGGVFTITASENPTSCASHGRQKDCPRCGPRGDAEIIAEVNATIARGVHAAAPDAHVLAWDWGWRGHGDASEIIEKLPDDVWLMSVSEWALPIERGGVKTTVGEYCLSAVGPGPRALRHWELAQKRGLRTAAKLQLNITWELAAVPYLPVLDLVAQHCRNLASAGVDGAMLSWTLGCYPSPNLRIAQMFAQNPEAEPGEVLDQIAVERYGASAAPEVRRAWSAFSEAFQEYPYNGAVVYRAPQQMGPANLLHARPTGYASTMVGLPYDDLKGWRGPYPPEIFAGQFQKVADGWTQGIAALERAEAAVDDTGSHRQTLVEDLRIARAAGLHFASVANQARFVMARDALLSPEVAPDDAKRLRAELAELLDDEIQLARALFPLARADSRIGFEATNQYFYVPQDLVEKALNCESLRTRLDPEFHQQAPER